MINTSNPTVERTGPALPKSMILASLLLGAVALPLLRPVQTVHADSGDGDDSARGSNPAALLGTWVVQVSIDPATVPPGSALNFTELDTFGAGGGFMASNNGPGAGQPPGQGNWVRTGDRQFALTQLRIDANPAHVFSEINKIRSTLLLNKGGDEFTVKTRVDIILPNGAVLPFHPRATAHGTRLAIEPLD